MAISTDILTLGPINFVDFSTPQRMPFGGKQAMTVHKYIGGSRVIDTTGPDDADIRWTGFFFNPNAMGLAQTLDALRIAGTSLPLTWGGLSYVVVIAQCALTVRRFPNWVEYDITCVVASDGAQGDLSNFTASADALVSTDLSSLQAIAGLPANVQGDIASFAGAYAAAAPISNAAPGLVSAAVSAAGTTYDDIVAAIPGAGAGLDSFSAAGVPAQIAAGISGLATAAQNQLALVNAQGLVGRAIDSLGQAGI